ncbi:aminopeptidase P family protein [Candidatus Uhrbacteria bacterium]|nr:aminopeptidase P family protein [Candidatus Uhrbacteria bacterium]
MYRNRLQKLRTLLHTKRLPALFVTSPQNVTYLSGFRGLCSTDVLVPCLTDPEVVLLITKDNAYMIADGRYTDAVRNINGFEHMPLEKNISVTLRAFCTLLGIKKLGVEYEALRAVDLHALQKILRGITIADASTLIPELRKEKDTKEITALTKASRVTDTAFTALLAHVRPGMTEGAVAHFLVDFFHRHADGPAFAPIVASDAGAAIPHYRTNNTKKIRNGEMLLLDFGAQVGGYHADMSRTIFIGKATSRFKKIYTLVLDAQEKTIAELHVGMRGNDADAIAREVLAAQGYKKEFAHSTGHGVGLQIHEDPRLSPLTSNVLKKNHVFTVEPGLYFPSWGGVRIEDTILLTAKGPRILTRSSKKLIEI